MKLACPVCHAKYTIADERLDGRRVRVRCKRCGDTFAVGPVVPADSREVSAAEAPASVSSEAEREDVWARMAPSRRGVGTDLFAPPAREAIDAEATGDAGGGASDAREGAHAWQGSAEVRPVKDAPLTGERNETSVLFSLATLTQVAPPLRASSTPSSTDSSSLIDLRALATMGGDDPPVSSFGAGGREARGTKSSDAIARLGGGGPFAPILAPPILAFAVHEEPAPRSMRAIPPLAIGVGLALVALAGVAFVGVRALSAPKPAALAAGVPVSLAPNAGVASPGPAGSSAKDEGARGTVDVPSERVPSASTPTVAPSANRVPSAEASNHASVAKVASASSSTASHPAPVPSASPGAASTASSLAPSKLRCCPGEDETMCAMRTATGALCPGETPKIVAPPFDRAAASRALGVSVASCTRPDGPSGPGHVRVVFQPSGVASSVEVDPPYAGTASGACIIQRYRGVTVPAFAGSQLVVGKTFTLP